MKNDAHLQAPPNLASSLQARAELLSTVSDKVGCGVYRYEKTGRAQLEALIRNGLNPWDKCLDIGCGAFSAAIG
jgi:aspartate aminotransferase-like enzyme